MRRKPLNSNPNFMHMIMENFRRYSDIANTSDFDTSKIYLFENNSKIPTSEKPFAELIEEYNKDIIGEDLLFEQWNKSIDYEYNILITEGIVDIIKKPFEAFANTKVAIAAKSKAKQALATIGAKIFGGAMKIIQALLSKARDIEKLIVSTVAGVSDQKSREKKIATLYEKAASMIAAGVKKLFGVAQKFITSVLKVFTHPLLKAAILVLCVGIVLLSMVSATIFVGVLAAAPLYASRRLGAKGAVEFWKMIPAPGKEAVSEMITKAKTKVTTLLNEAFSAEEVAQAIAILAKDIPEGEEVEIQVDQFMQRHVDVVQGAEVGDETSDEIYEETHAWYGETDKQLNAELDAIQTLQVELAKMEQSGKPFNWRKFKGLAAIMETKQGEVMQQALKVAKETCKVDPDLCQASKILAKDFEIMSKLDIYSDLQDDMNEIALDPNSQRSWGEMTMEMSQGETKTVGKNPFFDPQEVDPRFDMKPAEKSSVRSVRDTWRRGGDAAARRSAGLGLGADNPFNE